MNLPVKCMVTGVVLVGAAVAFSTMRNAGGGASAEVSGHLHAAPPEFHAMHALFEEKGSVDSGQALRGNVPARQAGPAPAVPERTAADGGASPDTHRVEPQPSGAVQDMPASAGGTGAGPAAAGSMEPPSWQADRNDAVPVRKAQPAAAPRTGKAAGQDPENLRGAKKPVQRASAEPRHERTAPADRTVTSASFSMSGSTIRLTLKGDGPMVGHYFSLREPDRIVLDIAGHWNVSIPSVPGNRLIRAVRVGRHEDTTRLVFDLKTPGRCALVPMDRNTLQMSIR